MKPGVGTAIKSACGKRFSAAGIALAFALLPLAGGFSIAIGQEELREQGRPPSPADEIRREVESKLHSRLPEYRRDQILVRIRGDAESFRMVPVAGGRSVEDALREYRRRADVEYAEPDYLAFALFTPNDPFFNLQWHFDNPDNGGIHAKAAWDVNRGLGVTVAVVDTGIAYEDFGVSFKKAPDLAGTCFVAGYDFINNDSHANDDNSHGTHVAGTIAQTTDNGTGVAGLAHQSCLMPVKVLDRNGSGSYSAVANGIRFAADNGAKVINLSLGGPVPSAVLEDAVRYAFEKGVTIVAAAGNDGSGTLGYPAAYDQYVIAVGATRFDEQLAPYSNFGPSLDVVAPGGDLRVDQNDDGYGDGVLQNTFNPNTRNTRDFGYWFFQGTSMATPHAAAAAALLLSNGSAATPDQVRQALQSTADDLGEVGRDNTYGWGLINVPAALAWNAGPPPPPPPPPDNPPSVSITNPANGATVSGAVPVSADATDDLGVARVDFFAGLTLIASDTTAPYETSWDSTTVPDGTYTLTATAVDTAGQSADASVSVSVNNVNDPPVANAGPDKTAFVGQAVNFDGSGSSDPDGTITSYAWNFGDGATASGVSADHAYAAAATYTVTLTVTDNGGLSASDTALVAVSEVPAEIEVFLDSFEGAGAAEGGARGASHNDGGQAASFANWTQDGQNDWFRSTQRATNGSWSAEVDGSASNAQLISVPVNLQGKTNATITFSWLIESGLDKGEYVAFDVSTDGGAAWVEKGRLRGNVDPENVWHAAAVELNGISNLKLRFRGTMSGSSEDANVDLVRVVAR